jgi:rod shape-determining protein MreC
MVVNTPKHKKIKIALTLFFLLVLAMISYHIRYPGNPGLARRAVLEIIAPVQSVLVASVRAVRNAWADYLHLVGLREENRELNKKIDDLTAQLAEYRESYLEAQRLQALLDLRKERKTPSVAARVVDQSQTALFKTILLNKGSSSGIRSGQPVLSARGVVGRVIEVSPHVSKVLLLVDEKSNIDALIQRTRGEGILQGNGSGGGRLKYMSNLEDVQAGDLVLTSGLSGLYPKGLPIGTVTAVDKKTDSLFQRIEVAPAVDFSRLEEVLVLEYKPAK